MKHPKIIINKLSKEANSLLNDSKLDNQNFSKLINDTLVKCEKAYDLYLSFGEVNSESEFRLEFNLTILYLLTNQNDKCYHYLEKIRKCDLNKCLDDKMNKKFGLICLKLAKNYEIKNKSDRQSFDKILSLYKLSADYFEKFNLSEKDDQNDDNQDLSIYCQILLTIAKISNIDLLNDRFLNKIISACKHLEDNELKAKIFSDLSTIMIRLALEKGNFHKAERLLKKAIGLINSEKKYLQGVIFHNLGALYNRYSHYQKAITNIQKAIDLFNYKSNPENEGFTPKKLLGDLYFNLGYAYAKMYRFEESKNAFILSINKSESLGLHKNKRESLTALGTLSIASNEVEDALNYFQDAIKTHQTFEVKDESYLIVENMLSTKIESIRRRIELNNTIKQINNDLTNTNDDTDVDLNDNDEKKTGINNNTEAVKEVEHIKQSMLTKLKERSVKFTNNKNSADSNETTQNSIEPTTLDENTNRLHKMELSTKKASGEFLEPVQNNGHVSNSHHSDVDDENSESQKQLINDYTKKMNELDETNEKNNQKTLKTKLKKPQKIDPDVIERVDGAEIKSNNEKTAKPEQMKKRSKICALM